MPLFTLQAGPEGPIVTAYIMVSAARHRALTTLGQAIPQPQKIRGLIDTGASGTCVDPSVLDALGLTPTGSVQVHTPTTGNAPVAKDQYDIGLAIPGPAISQAALMVANLPVLCSELFDAQAIHALIGRDVLSRCLLSYDGTTNLFTLCY